MKKNDGLVLDGVDLLLLAAILGIVVVGLVLVIPVLPGLGAALWQICRTVLMFWRWPFWIWTILSVASLSLFLWLHKRFG